MQASDVRNHIGILPVGERVVFEIVREGRRQRTNVVVSSTRQFVASSTIGNQRLEGVSFSDLDSSHPYFGVVQGVIVDEVDQRSYAWSYGLRPGDIITSVNRQSVSDIDDFINLVNRNNGSLLLRIVRGNSAAFLVLR